MTGQKLRANDLQTVQMTRRRVLVRSIVESDGFTGLAHKHSWRVGTRVSVRILAIDQENQRFSLAVA